MGFCFTDNFDACNGVEADWDEFWKPIVTNPDGTLNLEQIKRELSDFKMVMGEVSKVYCEITGNRFSKATTRAEAVIDAADAYYRSLYASEADDD